MGMLGHRKAVWSWCRTWSHDMYLMSRVDVWVSFLLSHSRDGIKARDYSKQLIIYGWNCFHLVCTVCRRIGHLLEMVTGRKPKSSGIMTGMWFLKGGRDPIRLAVILSLQSLTSKLKPILKTGSSKTGN